MPTQKKKKKKLNIKLTWVSFYLSSISISKVTWYSIQNFKSLTPLQNPLPLHYHFTLSFPWKILCKLLQYGDLKPQVFLLLLKLEIIWLIWCYTLKSNIDHVTMSAFVPTLIPWKVSTLTPWKVLWTLSLKTRECWYTLLLTLHYNLLEYPPMSLHRIF